jgi:hypothetical protein
MFAEEDFDLSAGVLRADERDIGLSVEVLASKLESTLPGVASVTRRKVGGFRSKRLVVEQILLALGEERFEIAREDQGYRCTRHKVVRGITLSRQEIPMTEWISAVIERVQARAQLTEDSRGALESLLR